LRANYVPANTLEDRVVSIILRKVFPPGEADVESDHAHSQQEGNMMATYIALNKLTAKGADAIKDTVKRSETFTELAKKLNVDIKSIYWGTSPYDSIAILEAPDDKDAMAFGLACKQAGFFTSDTLRVYTKSEMVDILKNFK
jgi:uncharacterized protein with GYD domain